MVTILQLIASVVKVLTTVLAILRVLKNTLMLFGGLVCKVSKLVKRLM
jgi:hypothetical protein